MTPTSSAFERLLAAVQDTTGFAPRGGGNKRSARCPAHEDSEPSLSITRIEDRVLVHCHYGCSVDNVLAAVKFTKRDLYNQPQERGQVARYDYTDRTGQRPTRDVGRIQRANGKKSFVQNIQDRNAPPLYRLPKLADAVAEGRTVYVVEGESDVHAIEAAGGVGTCNAGGAGNSGVWATSTVTEFFRGADVVIVADRDEPGHRHAAAILAGLAGVAKSVLVVEAATGKDACDHIAAGHALDQFMPADLPEVEGVGPRRRIVLKPASAIKPRRVVWAWDTSPLGAGPAEMQGRFPVGSLVIGAGRAGIGKSQFAAWLVAMITLGLLPGCWYGRPRSVIYAATEDSWTMTIVPRLIAAGADLDRVFRIDVIDDEDLHARLTLPRDTAALSGVIDEYDVGLVVLDPLLSMIDSGVNDYRAREVRDALEPVVAIADKTRCIVFGLAHFSKATGSDPLNLISGSAAFGQLIRAAVAFARDEEADGETFVLSQIKNNLGRENLPSLSYIIQPATVETDEGDAYVSRFHFTGEESAKSVRELLAGAGGDPHSAEDQSDAAEWLRSFLAEGELPVLDVLKAGDKVGFSKDVLKRAKKKAKAKSRKSKSMEGGPWVWYLVTDSDGQSGDEEVEGSADPEGSRKGAKGAAHENVLPSLPSRSLRQADRNGDYKESPDSRSGDPGPACHCGETERHHNPAQWLLCESCGHRHGIGRNCLCPESVRPAVEIRSLLPGGDSLPTWSEREAAREARDAAHAAAHANDEPESWPDQPTEDQFADGVLVDPGADLDEEIEWRSRP